MGEIYTVDFTGFYPEVLRVRGGGMKTFKYLIVCSAVLVSTLAWAQRAGFAGDYLKVSPADIDLKEEGFQVTAGAWLVGPDSDKVDGYGFKFSEVLNRQQLRCIEQQMEAFVAAASNPVFAKIIKASVDIVSFELSDNTSNAVKDSLLVYQAKFMGEGKLVVEFVLNSKRRCYLVSPAQLVAEAIQWKQDNSTFSAKRAQDLAKRIYKISR